MLISNDKYINVHSLKNEGLFGFKNGERPYAWRLLLNLQSLDRSSFLDATNEKNKKYLLLLNLTEEIKDFRETKNAMKLKLREDYRNDLHQIDIDLKRLKKQYRMFKEEDITFMYENILLLFVEEWPWVGYVQGMSDILVPILHVFCEENINTAESSAFFVFANLFKLLYYNYSERQPGIIEFLDKFSSLLKEKDEVLYNHLKKEKVMEHFYAFRWANCLFTREFSLENIFILFDAMLSSDVNLFLRKFSVALIIHFREKLLSLDFNSIVLFLQELDKIDFKREQILLLIKESFK